MSCPIWPIIEGNFGFPLNKCLLLLALDTNICYYRSLCVNPRTTEIVFFKNYQWGQWTPALNMSGFFTHSALVTTSLSYKWTLKCDICLWWRHNEFAARFAHAQWQCSCLISLPCEIVDANCWKVMLRQGPSLLETFEGTNGMHVIMHIIQIYTWLRFDDVTFCKIGRLWKWYILTSLATSLVLWQLQRV